MEIEQTLKISINIPDCKIDTIIGAFKKMQVLFLSEFVKNILIKFAEEYMSRPEKPFSCDRCGNNRNFIRKTKNAKSTTIVTIFSPYIFNAA